VLGADGVAQPRTVKVGLNNNLQAQILDGLALGDRVVVGEALAGTGTGAGGGGGKRMGGPPPMGL
jgi:macrolide-specific efflux system membrane fusion protein